MKTKYAAIVRQVHMAVEAFHDEYQKYPVHLDELEGRNEHKKVFFDGIDKVLDKYDLKFSFDLDNDSFVEVEGEKLELKVAVWTYYHKDMIKSWEL